MEGYFLKKKITAVLFLAIIFIFSITNILNVYEPLKDKLGEEIVTSSIVEEVVNDNFAYKYNFIEFYGYMQNLMDKDEVSNFQMVKDKDGLLHLTNFAARENDVYKLTARVKNISDELQKKSTNTVYLMTPDKYIEGITEYDNGIPYNYANETADNFLGELSSMDVQSIDFRKSLLDSGIDRDKLFFKTDHHWTIDTAFYAYTKLVENLNKIYSLNLDEDKFYTNKENYNIINYKNCYLGSLGRKIGRFYAGVDDFNFYYPKFDTSFDYYANTRGTEFSKSGRFENALIAEEALSESDIFSGDGDMYSSYLYWNQGLIHIKNNNVSGPKVAFIKDSLAVPLAAFFSNVCSEVYIIDPRYYDGDINSYISNIEGLDFLFISFSPQDLTEEFFRF